MKTLSVVIAYRLFNNLLFKKDNKALGSLPFQSIRKTTRIPYHAMFYLLQSRKLIHTVLWAHQKIHITINTTFFIIFDHIVRETDLAKTTTAI